eukprot:SAG31_NODE_4770_length_2967_cov_1.571478_1_plen_83_part_10
MQNRMTSHMHAAACALVSGVNYAMLLTNIRGYAQCRARSNMNSYHLPNKRICTMSRSLQNESPPPPLLAPNLLRPWEIVLRVR